MNEDASGDAAPRFSLPSRDDPGYDLAAARALLQGADVGDTASAEAATGYYWGEPRLRQSVEQILAESRERGANGWNNWPNVFCVYGPQENAGVIDSTVT